jgi:hypothetical protein
MIRKRATSRSLLLFGVLATMLVFTVAIVKKSVPFPCANSLSCEESFNFIVDNSDRATFNGVQLDPPEINISDFKDLKVLGSVSNSVEKTIQVDLSTQTLKAYDGDRLFMETKISSGKWFPTPEGEFRIWKKIRATKMSGGEGADYYYLPNVPYVMFFSNSNIAAARGFALHGAYWHNNFGHAMSHGCVNMRTIDAGKLYDWVGPESVGNDTSSTTDNPGTKIIIYGKAP